MIWEWIIIIGLPVIDLETVDKIRFAVIGCGHIGRRHIEMIEKNSNAELVAVCDILPFESKIPFFNDISDLLNSGIEIDVACVCTPNGLHIEQAIRVLDSGVNVVIEKPLGLTESDCMRVYNKSIEVNKRVFCVMQNRYSPPSLWIKKLITDGTLGEIYMVQLSCYWNRDQRYYKRVFCVMQNRYSPPSLWMKQLIEDRTLGEIYMTQLSCYWNRDQRYYKAGGWRGTKDMDGGTLFTQFSHFIDIMLWLFGDIENIQGRFNDFNHKHLTDFEDSGIITFDFANGGMGSLNYSTAIADKNLESSITIIGSMGSVKIGGQYMDSIEVCNIEGYTMPILKESNPPNDYGYYKGSAANHHYVIDNTINALLGLEVENTTILEGINVVRTIEAIYRSGN